MTIRTLSRLCKFVSFPLENNYKQNGIFVRKIYITISNHGWASVLLTIESAIIEETTAAVAITCAVK